MTLPPLPPVQSDAALAIFVHRSFKPSGSNDRFGDSERLALLGQRVLCMVVAEIFFEKRPMLEANDLEEELKNTLSDGSYDEWVTQYGLREKVACPQDLRAELKEAVETRHLFDAYVGALYVERSYSVVKGWIGPLVDPDFSPSPFGSSAGPPPPTSPPPPLPNNPLAPEAPKSAYLSLFNQTAAQRGIKVDWQMDRTGPGHSLTWVVQCLGECD
ncbi:hypothetical protein B0F90DRAFT_1621845 [Multifurca ochricompacta]|uniref:RNase III domain-containing protein n=1 Tax=Multifurca ochricompacta TaxID=376703 RepID=A0AAD4MCT1_9AGAM|nr:hypothetical protein B0F90DRAFT_1621845 [Multifurca ochricompacta]